MEDDKYQIWSWSDPWARISRVKKKLTDRKISIWWFCLIFYWFSIRNLVNEHFLMVFPLKSVEIFRIFENFRNFEILKSRFLEDYWTDFENFGWLWKVRSSSFSKTELERLARPLSIFLIGVKIAFFGKSTFTPPHCGPQESEAWAPEVDVIARSASYVGDRLERDSLFVCLSVCCDSQIFRSFLL